MNRHIPAATTENKATAWATNQLSNLENVSITVNQLISIISELWSGTNMLPDTLATKTQEYLALTKNLTNEEKANFIGIIMAYMIYKRDPQYGQGRKDESRAILLTLCKWYIHDKDLIKLLLTWYFRQGYWGDAWKILRLSVEPESIKVNSLITETEFWNILRDITLDILKEQLNRDSSVAHNLEKKIVTEQVSNCAKWCSLPRKKKGKGKDRVYLSLLLAKKIFPNIKEALWYYPQKRGVVDRTKKITVDKYTPLYLRWHRLFALYNGYIRRIRKHIPYVEKFMQKNKFKTINPTMLTSTNKLRLNDCLKNLPPRYLKNKSNTNIPRKKVNYLRTKYGTETRYSTNDRIKCAQKYEEHEEKVLQKQKEKEERIQQIKNKMKLASKEEQEKLQEQLEKEIESSTLNVNTTTPIDIYKSYDGNTENPMYEACFRELIITKYAKLADIPILCIADTSGSMYSTYGRSGSIVPIQASISLTAFVASTAPKLWRHKFIQFASEPYIIDMRQSTDKEEPSFFDYMKFMKNHQINTSSTNFEGVLNIMAQLFKDANKENLPKYLLFFSDMQFNEAVSGQWSNMTAGEQVKKLFQDLEFNEEDVPTIVFWNLNAQSNRPAQATEDGIVMLSGFNPKMLEDLDTIVENAPTPEQYQEILEKEQTMKKVNTWKTVIGILSSSKATVPFLESIQKIVGHELTN